MTILAHNARPHSTFFVIHQLQKRIMASALSPTEKLVLLAMASHFNIREGVMRPGIDTLAAETGLNSSTVTKTLSKLIVTKDDDSDEKKARKALMAVGTRTGGFRKATRYELGPLLIEAPAVGVGSSQKTPADDSETPAVGVVTPAEVRGKSTENSTKENSTTSTYVRPAAAEKEPEPDTTTASTEHDPADADVPDPEDDSVAAHLEDFSRQREAETGQPLKVTENVLRHALRVVTKNRLDDVRMTVKYHFSDDADPYYRSRGYSYAIFATQFNRIKDAAEEAEFMAFVSELDAGGQSDAGSL